MKADLVESIGKTKKWLSLSFILNDKIIESLQLKGRSVWQEFKEFISNNEGLLSEVKTLMVFNRYHNFNYISYFKNIESLHLRGTPKLEFPDLSQMNDLHFVSVNSYSKETDFKNLSTIPNLEKLWIGDFTIGPAIEINSCLLYTSPSPRDQRGSRMPSSA